jgi:YVTN family beta-propeller protein
LLNHRPRLTHCIMVALTLAAGCKRNTAPVMLTIEGTTVGRPNVAYQFRALATDADGDSLQYQFSWGDGSPAEWSQTVPSDSPMTQAHTWSGQGNYTIRVKARDTKQAESRIPATLQVEVSASANSSPSKPALTGKGTIRPGDSLSVTAGSTDPDEDLVSYMFTWGDTGQVSWTPFYTSGTAVTRIWVYADSGLQSVRVRAKDDKGGESEWSDTLRIQVSPFIPDMPETPTGPDSGLKRILYVFSTSSSSPLGDSIYYQFNEGSSNWLGPFPSGARCSTYMEFDWSGSHAIRARASVRGVFASDWSEGHVILIANRAPEVPVFLSGPDSTTTRMLCGFRSSAADPDSDRVSIRFDWGDGDTSPWKGYADVYDTHRWRTPGSFVVRTQARDEEGVASLWSPGRTIDVKNTSPNAPSMWQEDPWFIGVEQPRACTAYVVDPDEDSVQCRFAWGDGDTSSWSTYEPSGRSTNDEHSWRMPGTCTIRAQARDQFGALSGWSDSVLLHVVDFPYRVVDSISLRGYPKGIAVLPTGDYAYVGNGDATISKILVSSNSLVATIPLAKKAQWLAASPGGDYVYASDGDGYVSALRTADDSIVWTAGTGLYPRRVAVSPNGQYVYVACNNEPYGMLFVMNATTGSEVTRLFMPAPYGVVAHPSGDYVYVTCPSSSPEIEGVYVVRNGTWVVEDTIRVGKTPHGLALSATGDYLYVANHGNSTVSVVETSTRTVVDTIQVSTHANGPEDLALTPDGAYLYVTDTWVDVAVASTSSKKVVAQVVVGNSPYGIAMTPDGRFVYVVQNFYPGLAIIGF